MSWPFVSGGSAVASALQPLTADTSQVFRCDGQPWRWKGVSAFPLCARFTDGLTIQPFLDAFHGYNLLRVWDYVTWPGTGWESCTPGEWEVFLRYVGAQGFYVELTLLTDDTPARYDVAKHLVRELAKAKPSNLVLEIGNEPNIHKHIDVAALRSVCEESGFLFASGLNDVPSDEWFGDFLTAHTPRDDEWPRKCHDLLEYYHGGGPSAPTDPAHHCPPIADEPNRPDTAGYDELDFRAYFGGCSILGGGATFHFEGGKYGRVPTPDEARCAAAALEGLDAFPASAPLGPYRRIDEQGKTSRTYVVGNSMVRVRPTTLQAPESGWTMLDTDGILWSR